MKRTSKTAARKVVKPVAKVANARKSVSTVRQSAKTANQKAAAMKARGRVSSFSKKHFTPTADAKKANPRRKDSFGFKSLEIIRKKPGIPYNEFIAAGGRPVDLRWDIEHGNVVAA